MGIALGLVATLYFVSGLAGYLSSAVPNIFTAAVLITAAIYFLFIFFVCLYDTTWLGFFLWLMILLLLLAELLLGFLPPTARDELTHHLLLPKLYVREERIFTISFDYASFYPMLVEMLFVPWVRWGLDFVPKLIHGLFGFLTGVLIYCYLGRRLSPVYGLLGFFLFASMPAILRLENWAYVDLGLVFYATASLLCILRWMEIGQAEPRWLVLAGLLAGFASTTKPNGLLVLLLLYLALAWALGRVKAGIVGAANKFALFVFLSVVSLSPWLARNFVSTGNPFFPFFSSFFAQVQSGTVAGGGAGAIGLFAKRSLLWGESTWEIAALPLRVFFFGQDDVPQYFDGVLNPILILFLPWAFKGKWIEEKKILFGFALLQLFFGLFMVELRVRYILPLVPPLVILSVYGIHNIYLRIVRPLYLFAAVSILVAFNGVYLWDYVRRTSPFEFLSGRESRSGYLSRVMPDYPAIEYANRELPPRAKIYLLFTGRRAYYYEREYFHDGGDNPTFLLNVIQRAKTSEDIEMELRKRGITHLMIRKDLLIRFLANNLSAQTTQTWNGFVRAHADPLYQDARYVVLQIHA